MLRNLAHRSICNAAEHYFITFSSTTNAAERYYLRPLMKVLIIPESFPTDMDPVAGVFMEDQVKALAPLCELVIFNTNPWYRGVYNQTADASFFDFHLFDKKWPTPLHLLAYRWWERQSIKLATKLPKPDIIHLHGSGLRGQIVIALAAKWKVPFVVTEHTGPWSAVASRPAIFARSKRCIESADALLPVSSHLASEIRDSGINARRVEVLGNPVDTDFFDLRTTDLSAPRRILFLGRLDPFKGGLRTLEAFLSVAASLPDYRLLIAGEGIEAGAIQETIDSSGLDHRIEFANRVLDRSEMREHFHASSFLIFPSSFESFGLVGAEAMATGLPAILPNRTGPLDYFFPKGCIQVNPDSVEEIALAMIEMATKLGQIESEAIRNHILHGHGVAAYGQKLERVYASVISAKFVG